MLKSTALAHWKSLPANQDPLPHMTPIAYKADGSKYGACGVRIDGSPDFIDAVLSCLKSLIDGENHITRLELARRSVEPVTINGKTKRFAQGGEVCYVRLHMRGGQGAMASAIFDRHLAEPTRRFAAAHGIAE